LKELGRLIETAIIAGKDNCLFGVDVQLMGGGELHAVVALQGKPISKSPTILH
jgi:hypothetical protein